jgi:hypothetical protein
MRIGYALIDHFTVYYLEDILIDSANEKVHKDHIHNCYTAGRNLDSIAMPIYDNLVFHTWVIYDVSYIQME